MKKLLVATILLLVLLLNAETLFEIKDSQDSTVFSISDDGMRVFNLGDTLMVISASDIKAYIGSSKDRALSRSFSISTNTTGKGDPANVLEVTTSTTTMREGVDGDQYTDFSPQNIFLGLHAGGTSSGINNVFIGNESGVSNTSGAFNTFSGYMTGFSNLGGNNNTFIGYNAGTANTSGSSNVFVGFNAGTENTNAVSNTYIGNAAGKLATGIKNTFVGYASGIANVSGGYNSFFGDNSGGSNTGSYNVFLGYQAGRVSGSVSHRLYIDNSETSTPLIYGEFDNNRLIFNGDVGIGKSPGFALHIIDDYVGTYTEASTSSGDNTYGVYAIAGGGSGANYGVYGGTTGTTGTRWAGYFAGDINVLGTVVKSVDEIKIDHPLDPENKFLSHSNITSNERMNVYNGNIILGSDGTAVVTMPDWFESINTEYRYQLTAIGAPGPNLYISKKVNGNTFEISGGKDNMEVSWMITGIRNDNYAKENPIEVEKTKDPIEKGYYLHPEAYGLPTEKSIEYQHNKEIKDQSEK
ncbi:MAG: hypothetical protein GQ534_02445 [Candidatus Delongbacteria bacterium]|nr:hypothetical protein [Candidatus Delongbacteria bacterium]